MLLRQAIWLAAVLVLSGCGSEERTEVKSVLDKSSYSLGVDVGRMMRRQGGELDQKAFAEGVADALSDKDLSYVTGVTVGLKIKDQGIEVVPELLALGAAHVLSEKDLLLAESEIDDIVAEFRDQAAARQQEEAQKRLEEAEQLGEENQRAGAAFLAENRRRAGVVQLPSGLQYRIIKPGSGPSPTATDTVKARYWGRLLDGTEFDSSDLRGGAMDIPVSAVIKGWKEALQLMETGARWEIFVPSELAYGRRGSGPNIGPNSTLIFEIELVGIK